MKQTTEVTLVARLKLLPTAAGGRQHALKAGYRPSFWIGKRLTDEGIRLYHDARLELVDTAELQPGEEAIVRLTPLAPDLWPDLVAGEELEMCEGHKLVGIATVCDSKS